MITGSWDGTLKLWDVYKNECFETFEHGCDVLSASFRPDGKEVCTCATNGTNKNKSPQPCSCISRLLVWLFRVISFFLSFSGSIYIWDIETGSQVTTIEGRRDLASGRLSTELRTADRSLQSKHFKSVAYSPDGTCILAGGQSKYVCLYSASNGVLLKRFELSHNR
jgi:periodic tryptophan protein 2